MGDWKFIPGTSLGGFKKGKASKGKDSTKDELYNLVDDLGEAKNIAEENPGKTRELKNIMEKILSKPSSKEFN